MAGTFEVYEDKAGKYRFRLKAGNGEVVAQGEAYETRDGAGHGCEAVQRAADGASIKTSDRRGQPPPQHYRLRRAISATRPRERTNLRKYSAVSMCTTRLSSVISGCCAKDTTRSRGSAAPGRTAIPPGQR